MSARMDGRNGEVWRRHTVYGWTQERIAEHFGITQQRVSEIIVEVRKELKPYVAEQMVQQSMEFLRDVQARAMEIADLAGAPVAVGKDGNVLYEPCDCDEYIEHGRCEHPSKIVRDYSGRLAALRTARDIDESIRKLHGLNAPEKRELSGSVKYEIVGVDDDDLT